MPKAKKKGAKNLTAAGSARGRNATVRPFDKKEAAGRKRTYARIIARCWLDPKFKERFIEDPKVVFDEYSIDVPKDTELVVVENTPNRIHFILPPAPGTVKTPHLMERQPIHIRDCPCDSATCEHSQDSQPSANCVCVTCYTDTTGDSICSPSISG